MSHRTTHFPLFITTIALFAPCTVSATTVGPVQELSASGSGVDQRAPAVDWDGTEYVIVWQDGRNLATTGVDLYLARLGTTGAVMDAHGIPVLTPAVAGDQTQPTIAFNPTALAHVIAWTDPRGNNGTDIYAARFLGGSGSILEQAGFRVSLESDPDIAVSVGCAVQSCLFAWQATTNSGAIIRARRFNPDGTPVDTEATTSFAPGAGGGTFQAKPRVLSVGASHIITFEDDRNASTSGLDLFYRVIPDYGSYPPGPGEAITTAPLRQTEVDLAPVGPGLGVVWQDQRAGTSNEDVWGRAFTTAFAPRGAEVIITGAADDQQRPRIAGDSTGGLVVWQDRRSSPIGLTYGARLDPSGAVRDPYAFPLLVASSNVIEHAVAKGPGSDYLVAAVRYGTPSRIIYRVVRDEPPAGTMTAAGALEVASDGATPAVVVFGPARGASGLPVADGTLYTLTLSRPDVTTDIQDRDPATPGLQIPAVNGAVAFNLTSLGHGSVDVSVSSLEGTSAGSTTVIFDDVAPTVSSVVLSPSPAASNQDLHLTYVYSDVNGDVESGTTIEWTKNAAIMSAYQNQRTVPASATARGDHWRARVTPRDGIATGLFAFSNTATIGNTPPQALSLNIEPHTGVKTGTPLRGRYTFDDDDGDAQAQTTRIRWFDRGTEVTALAGETRVPGTMVVKGQVWRFSVEPNDGFDFGPLATSSTVAVENTIPVANAGTTGSVLERRRYTLSAAASSDADPQDTLRYRWSQVPGPVMVTLSATSSVSPSFTAPSVGHTTILEFELVVNDGEADSAVARVAVSVMPVADADGDGLDDEEEAVAGTDPARADTDRDGLSDLEELQAHTNPLDEDTDDDGVRDGAEGRTCPDCTPDPLGDPDGDGLVNALDPDSDDDGLFDGTELGVRTPPAGTDVAASHFVADVDPTTTTNPNLRDTDGDGVADGVEDTSHDGKVDPGESDPNNPADPPKSCTPGGHECPEGTTCQDGTCRIPVAVDGGLTCMPLAAQHVECCMSGCRGGTLVEPICTVQGAVEQCPVGANQCAAGSCSAPVTNPSATNSSGCGCSTAAGGDHTASPWILLAFGLFALTLRRRR